jgi:hypothetical protein
MARDIGNGSASRAPFKGLNDAKPSSEGQDEIRVTLESVKVSPRGKNDFRLFVVVAREGLALPVRSSQQPNSPLMLFSHR